MGDPTKLMCMSILPTCMFAYWYRLFPVPVEAEEGTGSPGTGVPYARESTRGCWDLNLGPLVE